MIFAYCAVFAMQMGDAETLMHANNVHCSGGCGINSRVACESVSAHIWLVFVCLNGKTCVCRGGGFVGYIREGDQLPFLWVQFCGEKQKKGQHEIRRL